MSIVNDRRGAAPSLRVDASEHHFKVGQAVRLKAGPGVVGELYRIMATLPPRGDSPQYRIRNEEERHERVTTQENLEVASASGGEGDKLLERTFSHGQGAATQQQRSQKAQAGEKTGRKA